MPAGQARALASAQRAALVAEDKHVLALAGELPIFTAAKMCVRPFLS